MSFQHIPVKAIQALIQTVTAFQYMGYQSPTGGWPVPPGSDPPDPTPVPFRWIVEMEIFPQTHSSRYTRQPGQYNGLDIDVGNWIADVGNGLSFQIISVLSKTSTSMTCIVQDIFRYNTFKSPSGDGTGSEPAPGSSQVIFEVDDAGFPTIDPKISTIVNSDFWINLTSRFNYINEQFDLSLFQNNNSLAFGDAVAVDPVTHEFVKASSQDKVTIGTVTSISDTMPNWFTINPVGKIANYLNFLPGDIGDIIYTDPLNPGNFTTVEGGDPVYVKLRNNGQTQTKTEPNPTTLPGFAMQINGATVEFTAPVNINTIASTMNSVSTSSGVVVTVGLVDNVVNFNPSLRGPFTYLETSGTTAQATINGVLVDFNIAQTWGTSAERTQAGSDAMASAINSAQIPNIIASSTLNNGLTLTNISGGAITIVNVRNDINGTPFAGSNSASGIPLSSSASTAQCVVLKAVDARAINLLDVTGSPTINMGLVSVENAPKACGLFIGAGLRQAANTVVVNLAARDALDALIGDQAFVIDSDDGSGNYVNQWSTWLWNGSAWVLMARESVSVVAAKTLEFTMSNTTASSFQIGEIVTGTRITDVSVEVLTAFGASATLELGYSIANPTSPTTVSAGIMTANLIDLSRTGMYVTTGDILFGTNTVTGDITITGTFNAAGSSTGSARILVSYV